MADCRFGGWVEVIGVDVNFVEETGCPSVIINAEGLEGGMVNDRLSACVYMFVLIL